MKPVKILLADSQYLIRMGLKHLISRNKNLEVVGESANSKELMDKLEKLKPDVVMFDYNDGLQFQLKDLETIKSSSPHTKVLVISSDENRDNIHKALETGINSFVTKECDRDEIISAIVASSKGEKFFCNKILDIILEKHYSKEEEDCKPTELTVREVEIVKLIGEGHSSKEIADKLHLSHHTVYTHRKNVMRKLGIKSTSELILYGINTGIIKTASI